MEVPRVLICLSTGGYKLGKRSSNSLYFITYTGMGWADQYVGERLSNSRKAPVGGKNDTSRLHDSTPIIQSCSSMRNEDR